MMGHMNGRTLVAGFLVAVISAAFALPGFAQDKPQGTAVDISKEKPSGTVEVSAEQIRLILGGSQGKGTLRFKGKSYPFTFKGGSAGGIGVTKVQAVGNVYFLKNVEDFPGTYTAVTSGAAVVKGKGRSSFQNDKGVYLQMRSKQEGVGLSLGLAVATVEFVK
jgi:hypothetical protein